MSPKRQLNHTSSSSRATTPPPSLPTPSLSHVPLSPLPLAFVVAGYLDLDSVIKQLESEVIHFIVGFLKVENRLKKPEPSEVFMHVTQHHHSRVILVK